MNLIIIAKTDSNKKDLDKSSRLNAKSINQKSSQNEISENKHVFQQIIQKAMDHLVDKKNLFVLTDEITNDEPNELESNKRLEILLSKMIDDKSLINDKTFSNNLNDSIITQIYLAFSPEAKKLLLESNSNEKEKEIQSFFHHLIAFNYDKFVENPVLTNEILISINNNLVSIDESRNNFIIFIVYNHKDEESILEEVNYNLHSKHLEEVNVTFENKLIFEKDKKEEIKKLNSSNNKIVNAVNIILEKIEPKIIENDEFIIAKDIIMTNLIDLMKSHEFENENLIEIINTVNNNQNLKEEAKELFNDVLNEENLSIIKKQNFISAGNINNNDKNIRNSEEILNKINENSSLDDNILVQSTKINPFIDNFENKIENQKININNKDNKSKSQLEEISNQNKFKKFKNVLNIEDKDKKRIIKINNKKPKFTHFEDDDSDFDE